MKRTKENFTILTMDPSLTGWGWAVLDTAGIVLDFGCIKTTPMNKKLRIRKGDDDIRRVEEITEVLIELVTKYHVRLITCELPHGSQTASAMKMVGVVLGLVPVLYIWAGIPCEWYSEADAKKCVLGKRSASKAEMIAAIKKLYSLDFPGVKYKDEAIADAIAIYHTAFKTGTILKMFRS